MKDINLILSKWVLGGLLFISLAMVSCNEEYSEGKMTGVRMMSKEDIVLDVEPTLVLAQGMEQTVSYTIIPDDITDPEITWSSSDSDIAEVSQNGVVKAKKMGTAIIKLTQSVAFEALQSFTVNVVGIATDMQIKDFEMYEKTSKALANYVTLTPENGYKVFDCESSNPSILSYENGKLNALSPGTVAITVKTKDGSNLQKTVNVKVLPVIELQSITLADGQEFALNETAQLSYKMVPADATVEALIWKSSNEDVLTVTNEAIITARAYGETEITVAKEDGTIVGRTTVAIVKGKINDYGNQFSIYKVASGNGKIRIDGDKMIVEAASKVSGYLERGTTWIDVDTYPILAIKSYVESGTGKGSLWHNMDFKVSGGSTVGANAGMNWDRILPYNDGSRIYYIDLSKITYDGGATLEGKGPTEMSMFKYKTGTDNSNDHYFELHWVKTFKSMDDLNAYYEESKNKE